MMLYLAVYLITTVDQKHLAITQHAKSISQQNATPVWNTGLRRLRPKSKTLTKVLDFGFRAKHKTLVLVKDKVTRCPSEAAVQST